MVDDDGEDGVLGDAVRRGEVGVIPARDACRSEGRREEEGED